MRACPTGILQLDMFAQKAHESQKRVAANGEVCCRRRSNMKVGGDPKHHITFFYIIEHGKCFRSPPTCAFLLELRGNPRGMFLPLYENMSLSSPIEPQTRVMTIRSFV